MKLILSMLGMVMLLFVAGCGDNPDPSPIPTPTSSPIPTITLPVVESVELEVFTKYSGCEEKLATKPGTCYLPIYNLPRHDQGLPINSQEGSKCTPADESQCWPQPGNPLTVFCVTTGQLVWDTQGSQADTWYGVLMPETEVLVPKDLVPYRYKGRVVGYVPSLWVDGSASVALRECKDIVTSR